MRRIILAILFILFVAFFHGCAGKNPAEPQTDTTPNKAGLYSYDQIELLTQTDCHFMGIKVVTFLPGKFEAQFEDEKGIYFYTDSFKNDASAYYKNVGICIPKNDTSEPFAFAEKGSPDSLIILSCDTLNITKVNISQQSKTIFKQE